MKSTKGMGVRCTGCGIHLQTEHKETLGYVPPSAAERAPLLCQRCFRIKHYNESSTVTTDHNEYLRLLNKVGETDNLVVHTTDIFDFEGTLIGGLRRFVGDNPIILVVNKVDLIPNGVNPNRIRNWVQRRTKEEGLRTEEIVLISAKHGLGFDRLAQTIQLLRKGRDVYIVGATNVGKSSIVNRMIREYSDLEAEITVSAYPGTTLSTITIPFDDRSSIVDTPGIVYPWRLTELIHSKELHQVMPDRVLKPMTYQLNPEQTLFFGALARFDFLEGERQSFTCYVSPALKLHRTKLDHADQLYAEQCGRLLQPPALEHEGKLPPLTKHRFRIRQGTQHDVFISGLGWIQTHAGTGALIELHAPRGVKVILRERLL